MIHRNSHIIFLFVVMLATSIVLNPSICNSENKDPGKPSDDYSFKTNVKTPSEFERWREAVTKFHRKSIRIKTDYVSLPLDAREIESIRVSEKVTRQKIDYATTDGLRIPAYLFIPDTEKKVPVVIVYHGHGEGKINAAEKTGTNENALAKYIADKLGYVVLAPDARSFGEFHIPKAKTHFDYYFSLLSQGRLYMTKLMEDGYQDLALLETIKEADLEHLGAAGISMGSWRTLNNSALHQEFDATVVTGLFIPWDYLFSEKHCRCQHIPALAKKMKMEDLAATLLPRKLMIQWGLEDAYYKQDAELMIGRIKSIADFLGYGESIVVDRRPGLGHRFSNPEIARFLSGSLGKGAWPPELE